MEFLEIVRAKIAALDERGSALVTEANAIAVDLSADPPDDAEARAAFDATTVEHETRADAIIAELADIRAAYAPLVARESELAEHAKRIEAGKNSPMFMRHLPDPTDVADVGRIGDGDARARALTMVTERSRSFAKSAHAEALTALIERNGSVGAAAARMALVTSTPTYVRAWSLYMSGREMMLNDAERDALAKGADSLSANERAGITSGTGATGGFLVPVFVDPTMIITGAGSVNPIRDLATVKTIGPAFGGWYGATAAQVTAAWTAEGNPAPDNTPVVGQVNIPVYMGEAFAPVSFQAFEDIADLAGDIATLFADAKANLEAIAFATGDGVAKPTGVMTAVAAVAGSRVAGGGAGVVALTDVFAVHGALPARFWGANPNRAWLANVKITDTIRTLAMAQNSANSVWTDMYGGTPPSLLGDPVAIASSLNGVIGAGNDVLLYGDFSRYYIIDRIGFTTEFIPNLFDQATGRPSAQRGWLSHWRTGANVVDPNAFRALRLI